MSERLYKWLLPDMTTAVQRIPWPVAVGEWTPKETPVLCESGWHGMRERDVLEHLPGILGAQLWVVETKGTIVHGDDKFAASQMRLVEHIGTTDERNLRLFAADCAEDVLGLFEPEYPNDSRPRTAIEVARRFANGEATQEELAAARAAARDAARDAARAAAWAAAWAAAGAARDAARAAAWAAAWAAAGARYSSWLVVRLESGY